MTINATNGNGVSHTNGVNGTNGHVNGHANGHTHENGTNEHVNGLAQENGINGDGTDGYANGIFHENGTNGESHGSDSNGIDGLHVDGVSEKAVPVAICGIGLRLPGGSSTPQEFWDFLVNKRDARGRVPTSRYNVSAYHETSKRPTTVATEYGYFLDEDVKLGEMDTTRFSMSRADVENADPQQRRLLEVVMEAFEDAGEANFRVCVVFSAFQSMKEAANKPVQGKKIGCYFGNMCEDWGEMMNRDPLWHGANKIDGYQDWMLANRISYEFGLTGPRLALRFLILGVFGS
jgi:hypothetical protein